MEKDKSLTGMVDALEQYYEAAGFKDVRKRVLNGKNENELKRMYFEMIDTAQIDKGKPLF